MDLQLLLDTPPWEWPQGLEHKLLPILRDKNQQADPADRLMAAEIAGDFVVINDSLANALLVIVENPAESDELRAMSASSFGAALEVAYQEDTDIDGFDDPDGVPISFKMYGRIKAALHKAFDDATVPMLTRRRILESAVRAPEDWQKDAIRTAYANGDEEWKLTAVFCMQHVSGFEKEILEALEIPDAHIHFHAVQAAGEQEVDAAWPHISALAVAEDTDKDLRLAAIEALSSIRPSDSIEVLAELTSSEDEDISEAASEAMEMAQSIVDMDDDEFDDDDEFAEDDDDDDEFDEDEDDDEEDEDETVN